MAFKAAFFVVGMSFLPIATAFNIQSVFRACGNARGVLTPMSRVILARVPSIRPRTSSLHLRAVQSTDTWSKGHRAEGSNWARRDLLAGSAMLIAASFAASPSLAEAKEGSGGWAKHDGPFSDADFAGFSKTSSGLQYLDVEVGTGPMPKSGQKIKAHYAGYLLSGKKFDSSYDRGQPLPFNVGVGQVIKGWDEGLLSMKVGGKRILLIPSELAYGSRNVGGGLIPANSKLVFYVELVTLAA